MFVRAGDIPTITITDKTNPKIAELYQKLQDKSAEIAGIESERLGALEENATAMYEKEQSLENKTLTATTTVTTGLGAMESARAIAEKIADNDAEEKMSEYITTMKCEYGGGTQVNLGKQETLPGGNELLKYYAEYKQLAEKLKATKAALNLRPGIESEILYDRAESGIYQYQNAEQQSGAYTSLSRALMNPEGKDAAKIATQKQENSEKLKTGLVAAGGGIVAGIIGNYEINKDAPKESSDKINQEYDDKVSKVNKEKTDIETELTEAIEENAKLVAEYNAKINELKSGLAAIKEGMHEDCLKLVEEYIAAVNDLELIENETDLVPDVIMPEMDSGLLEECTKCKNKDAVFYAETKTCECPADRPNEEDGKCVGKPVEVEHVVETPVDDKVVSKEKDEKEETPAVSDDPNICAVGKKHTEGFGIVEGKTRVGDSCTSKLVLEGKVFKRKNGTCGCTAIRCETRNGRASKAQGGQCVCDEARGYFKNEKGGCTKEEICEPQTYTLRTKVNDAKKFCEQSNKGKCRIISATSQNNNDGSVTVFCNTEVMDYCPKKSHNLTEKNKTSSLCMSFCQGQAKTDNCLYKDSALDDTACICNPTDEDLAESNVSLYKEVCGKDRHKTEGREFCIDNFFNWTQTQPRQAVAFAKDYARIKNNHVIRCVEKYRTSGNDDYIKCMAEKDMIYYEFKFDDITESIDATRRKSERSALCRLMGGELASATNAFSAVSAVKGKNSKCANISQSKCGDLKEMAQRYGHSVEYDSKKNACLFTEEGDKNVKTSEEFEDSLAKIEGLDNYYFFHEIQIRGSANLVRSLRTYAQSKIPAMKSFKCDDGYKTVKKADGILSRITGNTDDILRCYVDGTPIDFVFDDLSEAWRTTREAGESGIACKTKGGAYARDKCHGLDEVTCTKIGEDLKRRNPRSSGTRFVDGECELIDGQEQKALEDGIQAAMGAVALVDCAVGTHVGCVLAVVEGVSLVTEMGTGEAMQDRANEFLKEATKCYERGCAITTLKTLGGRVLTIKDALSSTSTAKSVDEHLARLIGYLEPEDLKGEVSEDDWNEIVRQLGGDPNDTAGWALKIANKIGFIGQFASVGASTLRLTGKAVARLAAKSAAKGGKTAQKLVKAGTKVSDALDVSGDAAKAGKGGAKTGDVAKTMERSQAKKLTELDEKIAELESETNLTNTQSQELSKLRAERNRIRNQVGIKDPDELARAQKVAYNPELEEAQSDYQKLLSERKALAQRMGTDKSPGNVELQDIDRRIANQEKKLKDLGADVEPVEPLWKADGKTTTPKKNEPKPAEPTTTPKEPETVAPKSVPAQKATGGEPYTNMDPRLKAKIDQIKTDGGELLVAKKNLTDDQWKALKENLAKDGVDVKEQGSAMFVIKKAKATQPTTPKANTKPSTNGGSTPTIKPNNQTANISDLAKKDTGTIIRESKNLNMNQQQELYSKLSATQKQSIAKLKVDAGEVKLPFGSNVDDLAKNPDLLSITGDYMPLSQKAIATMNTDPKLKRFNELANKVKREDDLINENGPIEAKKKNNIPLTAEESKKLQEINSKLDNGARLTEAETKEYNNLVEIIDPNLKDLRHVLSNDMNMDDLIANGMQYKEKLLEIIASDEDLARAARNFDKLPMKNKENFMNQIVKKLDASFGGGDANFTTNVKVKYIKSWADIEEDARYDLRMLGMAKHNDNGTHIIYILNNSPVDLGYGNQLDNSMGVFAHEYGHVMDAEHAEKVAIGSNSYAGRILSVDDTSDWVGYAEYIVEPTERSSRAVNEIVGTNFTTDLNKTIKSGKISTTPVSDLQKLKVQTGYTGKTFVRSTKETNKLGVDYYKFAPEVERSGSLESVVDNIKETGIEHVAVIKEDGKDVVAIFDNADDYNTAMRKVNTPTSTPKSAPKTSASALRGTDSIDTLKIRASSNFDNYLQSCVSGGACNGLPVDRLTKEEWQQLNQYAKSRGAELFETKMFNKKTGTYDDVMRFRRLNSTNDVVASTSNVANKLTAAQEEAKWRALYEKYAPGNQTFDNFKKSFGNNLDEAEEYAKNLGATESLDFRKAEKTADKLWTDFNNKYGTKGDKYPYSKYADIRAQGISADEYLDIKQKGMSTDEYWASKLGWSKEQIEDANKVYVAQQDVKIARNAKTPAGKGDVYSTFDSDIAALRKELQSNLSSSVYDKIDPFFHKGTLTLDEYNNLVEYVSHKTYDSQMLVDAFNKEPGLKDIASEAYDNFLAIKSENIRKIDEAAGLHGGVNRATRELIPKNEFVQNFVSGRVTLYEDIITQNPNIYNRAKRWKLLTTTEKEKLCKEVFEIADNKLGIQHVEFGVKDLVKEFGAKTTTEGYQIDGKVYLSSRHLPNMSFQDAMSILAHEQAHKVDALSPNKGILGSQLANLGENEGYIQGATGHSYADYRKELTEQSAWMIMDAMKKAISKLGL